MTRILIVEDERNLALGLRANLEVEQFEVVVASTGEAALDVLKSDVPSLVVLDLTLPGIDGYEVLARIRARGLEVPVLILSARAEEIDKVRGFRLGADDYVTKPFGVMELVLRIKAHVRRSARPETQSRGRWLLGNVDIDASRRIVKRGSEEVPLTPRAFELLITLLDNADAVMSRHQLLEKIWGYDKSVTTRTVDAHVAELRRKLEANPAEPAHILTVHKVGYRLRLQGGPAVE